MNYDYIENLSEDEMLELYDDLIENENISDCATGWECTCKNADGSYRCKSNYCVATNLGARGTASFCSSGCSVFGLQYSGANTSSTLVDYFHLPNC